MARLFSCEVSQLKKKKKVVARTEISINIDSRPQFKKMFKFSLTLVCTYFGGVKWV